MSNPATPNIPLRCGPVGPPFNLAAAVAALGFNGSITRVFDCPALPAESVRVNHDQIECLQHTVIPCTAAQLGRFYLAWWHVIAYPYEFEGRVEGQPEHLIAYVREDGFADAQTKDIGIKLGERYGGMDGPDVFPWVADGSGSVLLKPGESGPPFTVAGPNTIDLYLRNTHADFGPDAIVPALSCCLLVAEITTPSADAQRIIL